MAQFKIREENLERLEKKLATIAKKCEKSNFHFRYEITGEEFINGTDNEGGGCYSIHTLPCARVESSPADKGGKVCRSVC